MATVTWSARGRVEGRVLVALRARHGLTIAAAAARVRVDAGTWARWERSGVPREAIGLVEMLCLALDDIEGQRATARAALAVAPR